MSEWRKICCPIDFSDTSRAALEQAAQLAQRLRAELLLLYVRHRGAHAGPEALFAPPPRPSVAGHEDEDQLASWTEEAKRLAPGLVTNVELSGQPASEIVRFAEESACDAIVIGTHGRTGLKHLVIGSVAEEVVRTANCPVVVVRGRRP